MAKTLEIEIKESRSDPVYALRHVAHPDLWLYAWFKGVMKFRRNVPRLQRSSAITRSLRLMTDEQRSVLRVSSMQIYEGGLGESAPKWVRRKSS